MGSVFLFLQEFTGFGIQQPTNLMSLIIRMMESYADVKG